MPMTTITGHALAAALIFTIALPAAAAEDDNTPGLIADAELRKAVRLSTAEILQTFANVRDQAEVQDADHTRAVNQWYADGRFVNHWRSPHGSGKVTGRWRAQNGKRCVTILSGLPERIGRETCSPVYRLGQIYLSINPDGSVHGKHSLSPLDTTAN